ncbi:beta-1,4-galactosyltransferase galt-1-like [Hyperolius riggenbachi]|uniref:beta-1,4-galactosyltransferase galt-1-like n=1 Tax=Hyperolius riggenbachi TaxID=752182 RepID=UPI0035A3D11E
MLSGAKWMLYAFASLVFIFFNSVLFHIHQRDFRYLKLSTRDLSITRDTITALDNQTFIISPYYEPREGNSVRVIAIIHVSVKELFCVFHCSPNKTISVRAKIDLHRDRFGFSYGTADLLCAEPPGCDYRYISFQSPKSTNLTQKILFEIRNRPLPSISSNFTVCISTVYGDYNNVLQMVQSIEMYKILGASKVTIYNTSCSRTVDKVLRHYIEEGTLEVVQWPIDKHLQTSDKWLFTKGLTSDISYYGQVAALNDCLYRNMYTSKYILLNDIDEIILPAKDWCWSSLMERLQKEDPTTSVFCIENHFFPTSVNDSRFNLWSHVPGVNILQHPFREPIDWKKFNARKLIVNPRKVFQTSIHSVLKHTGSWKNLPQSMAILFHCTRARRQDITVNDFIRDELLWKYNMSLVPNVDKVIQNLFSQR